MMEHVVFLLEEPSARDFLEHLVRPQPAGGPRLHYIVFEGKQDLERQLVRRLRGWVRPRSCFVVIRDQDSGDCVRIKQRLKKLCLDAGHPDAIVRIVCRELESFYVGDWEAVARAYEKPGLAHHDRQAKFRNPDVLESPSRELKRLVPSFQKRDGARRIAPLIDVARNRSPSFRVLCRTLRLLRLLPDPGGVS